MTVAHAAAPPRYFAELGRVVSELWDASGRSPATLPDAAAAALAKVPRPEGLGAKEILSWAVCTGELLPQSRPGDQFGQPPLIVHAEEDFFVQALTWMDGTTSVHDHAFAGAFMVLEGASLHVPHAFSAAEPAIGDQLVVGELSALQPEVLGPGDTRPIEPGGEFIHALFHLERPTVTVVVRNVSCGPAKPQYNYWAPGVAFDGLWEDRVFAKRLQSIDTLVRLDPAAGLDTVRQFVAEMPMWQAFRVVESWCLRRPWDAAAAELVERLGQRSPALAPVLAPALLAERRVRRIIARRGLLGARHQRLLLALLANLPDTRAIGRILHALYPDQAPGELLLDWVGELASPALRGVSGLSLPAGTLESLRAAPTAGRERELLAAMGAAWAEPGAGEPAARGA